MNCIKCDAVLTTKKLLNNDDILFCPKCNEKYIKTEIKVKPVIKTNLKGEKMATKTSAVKVAKISKVKVPKMTQDVTSNEIKTVVMVGNQAFKTVVGEHLTESEALNLLYQRVHNDNSKYPYTTTEENGTLTYNFQVTKTTKG